MGILSQYGITLYHTLFRLSMKNFNFSLADVLFFISMSAQQKLRRFFCLFHAKIPLTQMLHQGDFQYFGQ